MFHPSFQKGGDPKFENFKKGEPEKIFGVGETIRGDERVNPTFQVEFRDNKTSIQWTPGNQVYLSKRKKTFLVKNDF